MVKDPRGTVDLQVPPGWKCDCCLLPRSKCATRWNTKWNHPPKSRILLYSLPWELWSHFITGIRQAKIKFSIHPFFLSRYFDWELEKSAKGKDTWLFLHSSLTTKIFQSTRYQDEEIFRACAHLAWVSEGLGEWLHLSLHHYSFWRWWQDQSLSIPSLLSPVHVQGRNTAELCLSQKLRNSSSKAGILSTFEEKHKIFWTRSMCFLADGRSTFILSLVAEILTASNRVGEQAALFPCSSGIP